MLVLRKRFLSFFAVKLQQIRYLQKPKVLTIPDVINLKKFSLHENKSFKLLSIISAKHSTKTYHDLKWNTTLVKGHIHTQIYTRSEA